MRRIWAGLNSLRSLYSSHGKQPSQVVIAPEGVRLVPSPAFLSEASTLSSGSKHS